MARWDISDRAAALHQDTLVWDMILPWQGDLYPKEGVLQRFRESGCNFVGLSVADDRHFRDQTIVDISHIVAALEREEGVILARSVDDIVAAKQAGKLAVGLHFQGSNPFQRDVALVRTFYDLGVRHALLAYNVRNMVTDGCHEPADSGLSRFGVDLIKEMNRVGMLLDLTHTGYRGSMEAMELSTAPCIFSHSNPKAVYEHDRNIRDDQIEACARTGGVVGIVGCGCFLAGDFDFSVEQMIRHIEHVIDLVGPAHVGLGLDFVYFPEQMAKLGTIAQIWPKGKSYPAGDEWGKSFPPESLPNLTARLLARGHSETDVRGIMGENFARVCRQVWK
jgi:membrane dipeptidase